MAMLVYFDEKVCKYFNFPPNRRNEITIIGLYPPFVYLCDLENTLGQFLIENRLDSRKKLDDSA